MMALLLGWLLATQSPALLECRTLDQAFDTRNMEAPCLAAANDATNTIADRAEAARLLGQARLTNGNAATAEQAFVQVLVLDPKATLPEGLSPRFQEVFAKARARVEAAAPVSMTIRFEEGAAGLVRVVAVVDDALARVAAVEATLAVDGADAVSLPMAARPGQPGTYEVMLDRGRTEGLGARAIGHDGNPLAEGTMDGAANAQIPNEADELPWLWIGVGAASVAAVAVGVVGVATLVWANTEGPLAPPASVVVVIE